MAFNLKARLQELAPEFKTVKELAAAIQRRGIELKEKTLYQAIRRNEDGDSETPSLQVSKALADFFSLSVEEFLWGAKPTPPPEDRAVNALEVQLLKFYRKMDPLRQDDLVLLANRWYSEEHPEDKAALPFLESPEKYVDQTKKRAQARKTPSSSKRS